MFGVSTTLNSTTAARSGGCSYSCRSRSLTKIEANYGDQQRRKNNKHTVIHIHAVIMRTRKADDIGRRSRPLGKRLCSDRNDAV